MKKQYLCPKCRCNLNIENNILLIAKNEFGQKGIVILHTDLGNYSTKFSSDFTIIEGDIVKFICPVCQSKLSNLKNEKLASFILVDENKSESRIIFSQIFGEKSTYKIEDMEVKESFGAHASRYITSDWILLK